MRLIDADKMRQKVWDGSDDVYTVNDALELIDEQPTITAIHGYVLESEYMPPDPEEVLLTKEEEQE